MRHEHILQACDGEKNEPLAFTVSVHRQDNSPGAQALQLGYARRELGEFFPGKEFEIVPAEMALRKGGQNDFTLGEAYVATYAIFEK